MIPYDNRAIAVLVAPFKDRTIEDARRLAQAKRVLLDAGWVPLFLPDTLTDVLDDHNDHDRATALGCSRSLLQHLARSPGVVALFRLPPFEGPDTEGMVRDLRAWLQAGGPSAIEAPASYSKAAVDALRAWREGAQAMTGNTTRGG